MTYNYHLQTGQTRDIVTEKPLSLKRLQQLVGGYIEMVWTGEPYKSNCLMVNEEGRLLGLPPNPHFPQLVGNVIEGNCTPGEDGYGFVGF
jgi:Domain of unknown function (DUF3846)